MSGRIGLARLTLESIKGDPKASQADAGIGSLGEDSGIQDRIPMWGRYGLRFLVEMRAN